MVIDSLQMRRIMPHPMIGVATGTKFKQFFLFFLRQMTIVWRPHYGWMPMPSFQTSTSTLCRLFGRLERQALISSFAET
jgi:hypothetical protein